MIYVIYCYLLLKLWKYPLSLKNGLVFFCSVRSLNWTKWKLAKSSLWKKRGGEERKNMQTLLVIAHYVGWLFVFQTAWWNNLFSQLEMLFLIFVTAVSHERRVSSTKRLCSRFNSKTAQVWVSESCHAISIVIRYNIEESALSMSQHLIKHCVASTVLIALHNFSHTHKNLMRIKLMLFPL